MDLFNDGVQVGTTIIPGAELDESLMLLRVKLSEGWLLFFWSVGDNIHALDRVSSLSRCVLSCPYIGS